MGAAAPPAACHALSARPSISSVPPPVRRFSPAFSVGTDDGLCISPYPSLSFRTPPAGVPRFVLFASRRRPPPRLGRKQPYEEFDDLDDDYEDEEEDDGEEGEGSFEEMQQWLQKKPAGFGEGKTYDTRLEDELWEEIEQSRKAQLANVNKLKNGGDRKDDDRTKKSQQQSRAIDVVPNGTRVRLWNLPRKKNIHRDLQLAFKGFPGLLSISPAVIGNEKTRDPICKGFAFVSLKSEEAAQRFVEVYSNKSLAFGKVEKQVNCCIINLHRSSNSAELPVDENTRSVMDIQSNYQLRTNGSRSRAIEEPEVETGLANNKKDGPMTNLKDEALVEQVIHDNLNTESWRENEERSTQSENPLPSFQKQEKPKTPRKKATKPASVKASKLNLPGSVSRLKVKERTVLTGVFSKYGREVALENR